MPAINPEPKPLLLIVDDSPDVLTFLHGLLRDDYRIKIASDGEAALRIANQTPTPDLILLDVMMPDMGGHEVCKRLKMNPLFHEVPMIFLTAQDDVNDEITGFEVGAIDYIHKPVSAPVLQARIRTHLALKRANDLLHNQNIHLESEVARRTSEVIAIQDGIIVTMASLAETRDNETGNHIIRTQNYVQVLAERLRTHAAFSSTLTDAYINLLFKSAPLHDIGKVGIPDHILLKSGKLTPEEFVIMKTHTTIGYELLTRSERRIGQQIAFFDIAKEIALCHQEKWDGSGYPQGLIGEAIPLSARLMAVADVYDALISRRVYKEPMSHEEAIEIINKGRGQHFDPRIVDAFMQVHSQFKLISAQYQ